MDKYQQITAQTETNITIKNSKFIVVAEPVFSNEEAEERVLQWREIHPKANHHCYAYRIGSTGEIFRANDDGEPSGTAGMPIYRQLQSFHASNTLITVIRYFGGILLGAGGLVKAYKQSAREVLTLAQWVEIVEEVKIIAVCAYPVVNVLLREAERADFRVCEQHFDLQCQFVLQGAKSAAASLVKILEKAEITTTIQPTI